MHISYKGAGPVVIDLVVDLLHRREEILEHGARAGVGLGVGDTAENSNGLGCYYATQGLSSRPMLVRFPK